MVKLYSSRVTVVEFSLLSINWRPLNVMLNAPLCLCMLHCDLQIPSSPSVPVSLNALYMLRVLTRTLRHIAVFSPLLDSRSISQDPAELKRTLEPQGLSELPKLLSGNLKLNVPVYTIYGASEDLTVLEKFKTGEYNVPNLHIISEDQTFALETPSGHTVRLMGLGGSLVLHRFFDNGDGTSTIAGTHGLMWTTAIQIGQLIQTVRKNFDPAEIRIFVSHSCPSKEGLLAQLAHSLRADFTISSGLHFIYGSSFNEFTTEPTFEHYCAKLAAARAQFMDIWDSVKAQITMLVENDPKQKMLLNLVLDIFEKMPSSSTSQPGGSNRNANNPNMDYLLSAYRNTWNFNLCDAQFGSLVLNVVDGRVAVEAKSEGFNFQYRKPKDSRKKFEKSAPARPLSHRSTPSAPSASAPNVTSAGTIASSAIASASAPNVSVASANAATPDSTEKNGESKADGEPEEEEIGDETTDGSDTTPSKPGLWIASISDEETLRSYFHEDDRALITGISLREAYNHPEKKFALVYFSTNEQAQQAMDRIDRERVGRVSIIGVRPPRGRGGFRGRGGGRGGRGGRGSIRRM